MYTLNGAGTQFFHGTHTLTTTYLYGHMKFTDRFMEVPIELFNSDVGDLIGTDKAETTSAIAKVNPFEISFYRETAEQSEDATDELNRVIVYFKNGESLYLPINITEFEKLLNAHK